ncbi:MAG: hypothetical protein FIB08_03455 [Candidatus Methanoperedens sp.]|nr:hypothetical protein [Candidatus Methanoperedens sp.]
MNIFELDSNWIIAWATVILVVITVISVGVAAWNTRLVRLTLKEMQKSRKAEIIGRRLEELYKLRSKFNSFDIDFIFDNIEKMKTVNTGDGDQLFKQAVEKCSHFKKDFDEVVPSLYLVPNGLESLVNKFIQIFEANNLFVDRWDNLGDNGVLKDKHKYDKAREIRNQGADKELETKKDYIRSLYLGILQEVDKDIILFKSELNNLVV